ncbi:hypothetical protein AX16_005817 [Volvariella volvacea WC 439]|nr:hypothetical protein AX16_005817 [Volvariella volvacea WC 439]
MTFLPNIEQISDLDDKIRYHYARIQELCEARNTLVPINQFPAEVLGHIFKEVGITNRSLARKDVLVWNRNIVHVCRHWRFIGLEMASLWECIDSHSRGAAVWYYVQRARRSQNVEISNSRENWELILSLLERSDAVVASITARTADSCRDFLLICDQFRVLSSIHTLKLPAHSSSPVTLPTNYPFFCDINQPLMKNIILDLALCIPWEPLHPQFTRLECLSAGAPITGRQDGLAFLNALRHMTSLKKLRIGQDPRRPVDVDGLKDLYDGFAAREHQCSDVHPWSIELVGYGYAEIRLVLTSLSLINLRFLLLHGKDSPPSNHLFASHEFLRCIIPSTFLNLAQYISLEWMLRDFRIKGSSKNMLSLDLYGEPEDLVFDISGSLRNLLDQDHIPAQQCLQGVINSALLFASSTSCLHIRRGFYTSRFDDGSWPAMMVAQAFPQIRKLVIDGDYTDGDFLLSSGLSCFQRLPQGKHWTPVIEAFDWDRSSLQKHEFAIGIAHWSSMDSDDYYSAVDNWVKRFRIDLDPCTAFSQSEHIALRTLATSLLPDLEVLELPGCSFSGAPDKALLLNCIYFRRAIGLPIKRIVLNQRFSRGRQSLQNTGIELKVAKSRR